ncbi:MAG: sce7725 family protein, partial [Bacteroidales bacterium]|nr:sce7725 family protein [Bacteroidales bacterium]
MYQPYVRGKQFELIGLRELTPETLSSNRDKISPIIEPVRNSSTLKSTIETFVEHNINFTIIINPQVGPFTNSEKILEIIDSCVGTYRNFQIGIIFHRYINHHAIIDLLDSFPAPTPPLSIIHNYVFDNITEVMEQYNSRYNVKYNVINMLLKNRRYYRNFHSETRVELDDYFESQDRNADYLIVGESDFSEEHLYYKEDGYVAFSDFSSIGADYSDSGFLPWAVVIHLSYSDDKDRIKIKHFTSDSNDGTDDVAAKFTEALDKL